MEALVKEYRILGGDFRGAGTASKGMKKVLAKMGACEDAVWKVAIVAYEAEMNMVLYAHEGVARMTVTPERIVLHFEDKGPGIPDIELAMKEGYSTATPEMREMGFGAGRGLPNIQKTSDSFKIESEVGVGTKLEITIEL